MLKNKSPNFKLYLGSFLNFVILFLISSYFVASLISLLVGIFTMVYLSVSILLSVYLSMNKRSSVLSGLILIAKAPVAISVIYIMSKLGIFEAFSFVVGVLIVLPSLVILSYRKI